MQVDIDELPIASSPIPNANTSLATKLLNFRNGLNSIFQTNFTF